MSTGLVDPSAPARDGRRRRGDASRLAILRAASSLIVSEGVDAISHRQVAEAAGVPLARVSYHFPKVDDLLVAAAAGYLADFDERLREMAVGALVEGVSIVEACTGFLLELVTDQSDEFLAMVEVRLALHRRGTEVDGTAVLEAIRSFGVGEQRAASIMAALFGFAVLAATAPVTPSRRQVRSYIESVLGEGTT